VVMDDLFLLVMLGDPAIVFLELVHVVFPSP
jgi:hypothetical protein